MKKNFILAFILLLTTFSCSKPGNDRQDGSITVKGDVKEIHTMMQGGNYTVDINATCDWQATADMDWVQITPASGAAGDQTLSIQIGEFASEDDLAVRNAKLTLKNTSGESGIQIDIIQYASDSWAPSSLNFGKEAGTKALRIYSPDERPHVEWLGEADGANPDAVPEWAELIQAGEPEFGIYTYTINVKENTTGEERMASLQPCFAGACSMIFVIQKGE